MITRFALIATVLCAAVSLPAQISSQQAKAFQNVGIAANVTVPHIHTMPRNCKGQPDSVYGKSGKVYYACIGEKDVCSAGASRGEKIPSELIAAYDANMAEFRARQQEYKERQAARQQTTTRTPLSAGRSLPAPASSVSSASPRTFSPLHWNPRSEVL